MHGKCEEAGILWGLTLPKPTRRRSPSGAEDRRRNRKAAIREFERNSDFAQGDKEESVTASATVTTPSVTAGGIARTIPVGIAAPRSSPRSAGSAAIATVTAAS
jgi:hypothetical protein